MAFEYPLGVGVYHTGNPYYEFRQAPHNVYLLILIETGWFGILAFCGFLILTFRKSIRFVFQESDIQAVYIAIVAATGGLLVQSLFVDSTHWRHMYLLFGLLWGPLLAWQSGWRNMYAREGGY
jgi:O-antigen ligase